MISAGQDQQWQQFAQVMRDNARNRIRPLGSAPKGARRGLSRLEYEYPLALDRAWRALITVPPAQVRYEIHHHDGLVWSVDRFEGPE